MQTDDGKPTLGQKIREARRSLGLTQSELAGGMVTTSMISQIEADKAKPSYELLKSISQRLQMDVDFFMNDTQKTGKIASQLRIAEYQTLAKNGEIAVEILNSIDESTLRGAQHTDYLLLMACAYRLCEKFQDALDYLDLAREVAYRTHDAFLFVKVYRESGYIEYAMKNYDGAIMEWKNAVSTGEVILSDDTEPHAEVMSTLRELYVLLANTVKQTNIDGASAHPDYLARANERFNGKLTLQDIADAYIEDAMKCVDNEWAEAAEELAKRATAIRLATSEVHHQLRLEALTGDPLALRETLYASAADAVIASNGPFYLKSELALVNRLVDIKQYKTAQEHLHVVESRIVAWMAERHVHESERAEVFYSIHLLRGDILHQNGRVKEALDVLESFMESECVRPLPLELRKTMYGRIIQWNVEVGNTERIAYWLKHLEKDLK